MEFVILLDIKIENILIGGSGEKSGMGDRNVGVVYVLIAWTMILDEIIKEAGEEKCEDSPGLGQYLEVAAWAGTWEGGQKGGQLGSRRPQEKDMPLKARENSWGRIDDLGQKLLIGCKAWELREFPVGPVVKTQGFHCPGPGFSPWLGNEDPIRQKKNWDMIFE